MSSGTGVPQIQLDSTATKELQIPAALFPAGARPGDLLAIRPLHPPAKGKDRPLLYKIERLDDPPEPVVPGAQRAPAPRRTKVPAVVLHPSVAQHFPWVKSRSEVSLSLVMAPPPPRHVATNVELYFQNVYLSRPDQFRLSLSLVSTVLFLGQRVALAGSQTRLRVGAIFNQEGKKVRSAYVDDNTKIAFRSESARCFVCVEVAEEMWHFEEDGSTLREKCEMFLAELFRQFYDHPPPTSHTVTIILYGRVLYEDNGEGEDQRAPLQRTEDGVLYRDFYKVLLDLTPSPPRSMARTVAAEIRRWEQDVLLRTRPDGMQKLAGRLAFAHESNLLEATNLALNSYEEHWIDRDLQRTGLSLLVLTAGTSFYQVDKHLLRITTERMLFHGVGLDIISLSKAPLHTVPLFSFRSHEPGLSEEVPAVRGALDGAGQAPVGSITRTATATPATATATTTRESLTQEASRLSGAFPDDQRDPLYYDAPPAARETSEYYAEPLFVFCSFFGFQMDKPHRLDRFMPRARCYELFAQGMGQRMPIAIPLLPATAEIDKEDDNWSFLSDQEKRQARRDRYDAIAVGAKRDPADLSTWSRRSGATSGTSSDSRNRFGASRSDTQVRVPAQAVVPIQPRKRDPPKKRQPQVPHSGSGAAVLRSTSAATAAIPIVDREAQERGRARAVSDARLPSTTRSRTPVGRPSRPRSPSTGSVATVSTRATTSTKPSATPALIARLTAVPTATPNSTGAASRPGWLGLFRTGQVSSTTQAPSVAVQRVEAFSNVKPEFDLEGASSIHSERRSSRANSTSSSSRQSSSTTPARPTPTQPISISTRAAQTREADRVAIPHSLSPKKFVPVLGLSSGSKSKGSRSFGSKFNPSMPGKRSVGLADQARRWASIFIRHSNDQRAVNWVSITRGACLPITTDYLPTSNALATQYSDYRYSIPTTATAASFLLRTDDPRRSPVLELVTELISQRLSQGFQICTPANALGALDEINLATSKTIPDVLRDIHDGDVTAIYLSLANQIHRVSYDRRSHAVVVKILTRRSTWKKEDYDYKALIWTQGAPNFSHTEFTFPYPRLIKPSEWQHLDRLVAGVEKPDMRSIPRFWRTRLILLPAESVPDREYLISKTPAFEDTVVTDDDINYQGFLNLMGAIAGLCWASPGTKLEVPEVQTTTLTAPEWAADVGNKILQAEDAQASNASTPQKARWLPRISSTTTTPAVQPPQPPAPSGPATKSGDRPRTPSPSRLVASPVQRRPTVTMTYSVILDLDPQKRSDRAERVMCHYDRSHNSRAAYHIELTWLAGSGKIIDNTIQSWTRTVARWGLNLVEISTRPVESRHNPFQKATQIRLKVPPPPVERAGVYRYYFESGLLHSLGFFLDVGADDTFPSNVDVQYSYRRASIERSQYIHRSGTLVVCILGGEEGFAFVPNRIFISHSQSAVGPDIHVKALKELCADGERLKALWVDLQSRLPPEPPSPALAAKAD